jgi:hypothetical protein
MFPNVRLMVVAILAAIAGIGCGLGLFATFRVNHEPLARLADGSPPLQLTFDRLGLNSEVQAPLAARLPVERAAKAISVPLVLAAPGPDPAGPDAAIDVDSVAVRPAVSATAEMDQNNVDQSGSASVAAVVPTEQAVTTREDSTPENATPEDSTSAAVPQNAAAAAADQESSASSPEPAVSPPAAPSAEQAVAVSAVAAEQPSVPASEPAASPPVALGAEQTAAVNAAAPDPAPAARPAKAVERKAPKPAARAAHPAPARRTARVVRVRRTATAAAYQPAYQYSQTTYAQPTYAQQTYNWADGASQASQTAKRVQIKRHRAVKSPAAQSNSLPATAGLSGSQ